MNAQTTKSIPGWLHLCRACVRFLLALQKYNKQRLKNEYTNQIITKLLNRKTTKMTKKKRSKKRKPMEWAIAHESFMS